jgi:isopenicillin N synthase-like dioxygenase
MRLNLNVEKSSMTKIAQTNDEPRIGSVSAIVHSATVQNLDTIPVIDFAPSFSESFEERRRVAREINSICSEIGFFYAINHGVPEELCAAQLAWSERYFALSLEEKLKEDMRQSPAAHGYEALAQQVLDPSAPPDFKEGFYIGVERGPKDPMVVAGTPNHGPNQWPEHLPGFRDQMTEYFSSMQAFSLHMMRIIALSLDLEETFFDEACADSGPLLRLIHYPAHPSDAKPNQLGAGTHTDWGAITLLLQDNSGGLEVETRAGTWVNAKPLPNSFVVNIADMMERWTNGTYKSNRHRVLNNRTGRSRYSVPFFFNPNFNARVECVPTCTTAENPPKYEPCTVSEHIAEMYKRSYGSKHKM